MIVAMDDDRGIGKDGAIPWHIPADLKRFKALTTGHPIVMGRKTWESIGRPLPERTNIVITRDSKFTAEGCVVTHSLDGAIVAAADAPGADEIFIIGGAEIYALALPQTERIYLTHVSGKFEADTFFPTFAESFHEVRSETLDADGKTVRFVDYERS